MKVKSSHVDEVEYDSQSRTLTVRFKGSDSIYEYSDVHPNKFRALMAAASIGAYLNNRIKPMHKFTKIDPKDEQ